jgi:hypothetical protein
MIGVPRKQPPSYRLLFANTLGKYMVMNRRIEDCLVVAKPSSVFLRYPEGKVSCTLTTLERRKP